MESPKIFEKILNVVEANTKRSENYLSVQKEVSSKFRDSLKSLYDFTKEESKNRKTEALPELITDGFDAEQIWQQLELQNEGEWAHLLGGASKALTASKRLKLPEEFIAEKEEDDIDNTGVDDPLDQERISADDSELSDENDAKKTLKKKKQASKVRRKTKPSIVDDEFFKLEELDTYLNKEDKKAMQEKKTANADSDEEIEEESIDLFNVDSENENEDKETDARFVKYGEFFDEPMSNGDSDSMNDDRDLGEGSDKDEELSMDGKGEIEPGEKRVKFNIEDESESEEESVDKEIETEVKSSLEMRQERLRKKIEELEKAALSEKPWQLKGEVDAVNRPQNSLLEEHVEFDITTRPAPVITEQMTLKLEDIIKQRIKDKAWDDVEKKFKPVETPMEYKKKLILDQEKSKVSLAQIYENEYLKQKEALNPDNEEKETEEPKEHLEIREMMHSLFAKLDALSNFHYTPKMAKPDVKIVSNLPAVTMEEVAPVAMSEATLLAPEEIKAKSRGDVIGKAERTETDMKRERRKKKLNQREREKARQKREKIVDKLRPGIGNKYTKDKMTKMIDNLSKERNISKIDETGGKVAKSSTAFFNELQDQVKSHIKSKSGNSTKKKDKHELSAVKLKL